MATPEQRESEILELGVLGPLLLLGGHALARKQNATVGNAIVLAGVAVIAWNATRFLLRSPLPAINGDRTTY